MTQRHGSRKKRAGQGSWEAPGRAEKRERFRSDAPRKKGNKMPLYIIAVGSLLFAGLVGLITMQQTTPGAATYASSTRTSSEVTPINGEVRFATADFADGRARFYYYRSPQGKTIPFFVMRSSDGVIRAAFDACDVCYAQRKGYRQEGDVMVCNNCGQRFPSVRINIEEGGCNPAPLTRTTQGDTVVILEKDIVGQGARYL